MSKTSILHLTYDMRIGGTEMVIKNLIEGSDPDLFDMSIFCIETPIGPWGIEMQNAGLPITATSRKPGFDISLIFAIRKHLKANNINLLHCHQYTPWVYGVLAAFGTKTKVVFTEHGRFYPDSSTWKRKLINPWLARITKHITAISQATKQALVDFENLPKERVEVIYNGIAPLTPPSTLELLELRRELGLSSKEICIGTIARFDPIKNHLMMLQAFKLCLDSGLPLKLLIVGDGEMRETIEAEIVTLDIQDKVILTGYKDSPQTYLALMDIFLLSSFSEGTSMTLLEAMSLGKPCIVTDAGGNKEVIQNGENGTVTENDSTQQFAKAILTLINDSSLYNQYHQASHRRFDLCFEASIMVSQFEKMYQKP
ncbi:glycosyltransferase [Paraglaciecola sp. MB-3u-78]|uniref:glycosyltransferase n=1 Tax=Paraglaciecola sp. MB-3u-78 TaxID=2058332 RepID=UPI000C33C480|nr:glycosyltransferase [Paraglaciecola sp. MB-3u-78]PKG92996.1 glycosyltransferase [Paraglaciecola sp. MB-3u-78]